MSRRTAKEQSRMQEQVSVTGMILKTEPIGEYDRRIVILTRERGKLSAFARGARKQTSRLLASTNPFCFGEFRLYEGRTAYTVSEVSISNYFEGLREDFEAACYGMYFLEVMDYYTRENNDEKQMLKLLYQSVRALLHEGLPNNLVRYIFEIKALALNGEYPGLPERKAVIPERKAVIPERKAVIPERKAVDSSKDTSWQESTVYAVSYIVNSTVEKLYTFTVSGQVLEELGEIADRYRCRFVERKFKSLEILDIENKR